MSMFIRKIGFKNVMKVRGTGGREDDLMCLDLVLSFLARVISEK